MVKSLKIILTLFLIGLALAENPIEKYTTKETPSYISSINIAEY